MVAINEYYSALLSEYDTVFTEKVGKLKGYKVKLHIDRTITPKQQPYRRVPYHLAKPIEKKLDKLIENDVIEAIEKPSEWVSALVAVPKPKKPGEVRLTIDSRFANKAIKSIKYVTPTTEEIAYDLNGATVFSRIDLNKAFHQLELDEGSRDITTFVTHRGFYRFRRLHMGVESASHEFGHVLQHKVLSGLEGVRNIADDIIVYGKTREEHDKRLVALLERMRKCGLTSSGANCEIGAEEITFFGLKLSKNGVALNDDKVEALLKAATPTSVGEVHSLLGLAVYASSYIPNLATIAKPLWDLTREGVEFIWEEKQVEALRSIKEALVTTALGYFNIAWITEVTADASQVGLALLCAQIYPKDERKRKIITYASRTLTDVERRYSHVEKDFRF